MIEDHDFGEGTDMSTLTRQPSFQADNSLPNGDILYEMVDGQLVEKDVSTYAVWIANLLKDFLGPYCREAKIGTVLVENVFVLDAKRQLRRRPDVAVVLQEAWPVDQPPPPTGDWELIPGIAVEVISPNDTFVNVTRKVEEYFRYGVREVWVVIPEARIVRIHHATDDYTTFQADESFRSDLISGWSMSVAQLLPHRLEADIDED